MTWTSMQAMSVADLVERFTELSIKQDDALDGDTAEVSRLFWQLEDVEAELSAGVSPLCLRRWQALEKVGPAAWTPPSALKGPRWWPEMAAVERSRPFIFIAPKRRGGDS